MEREIPCKIKNKMKTAYRLMKRKTLRMFETPLGKKPGYRMMNGKD
jgi:hypothetical protein